MVIDRIGNINKVIGPDNKQNQKVKKVANKVGEDTVSISKEAQAAQEAAKTANVVKSSPDIRAERVKEVQEKLARGDYDTIDAEILDRVADKIADALIRP